MPRAKFTAKVFSFLIVDVLDPGWIGKAGSCSAAPNSGTFGTESALAFTVRLSLVWSSKIHASLVVLVTHDHAFVAVSVAPMLFERALTDRSNKEPLLAPPDEFRNPSGVKFLVAAFDSS